MTAKVVNITLLSLSMLATLTASSQSVEIKRPKFHNSIHTERYLSPSEKISDYLYYDGFGREVMHSTNGMGSGNYIVHTFKEYGADGNVLKEYLPITTDMFHRPDAIDFPLKSVEQYSNSEGYTDYTYDVLGRTTAIRKAGEVWKNHPCNKFGGLRASTNSKSKGKISGKLTGQSDGQFLATVYTYGILGELTKVQTRHDNGWIESQETSYTYTLKPDTIRKFIEFNGEVTAVCETVNEYNSATDLPVASIHKCRIGDFESAECRIDTEYDSLGHIVQIKRPINNGIADVKYCYNMHGCLTGIKGGRFEQQILYETGSGTPQYSGNISSVVWRNGKNGNRSYCFTYDTLNRLEKGEYTDVNSSATEEAANYGESVTYDSNGNITRLVRHGKQIDQSFGVVDTLSISYSGNRIIGVEKGGEVMPTANSLGIRQGSHDFAYNAVGAITQDGTRGITDIEYDLNSNPIRIQFNNGGVTKYLYSVDGQKLRTIHLSAPPNIHVEPGCKFDAIEDNYLQADTTTYFFGGTLIYCDGKFKRYLFDGGYIDARYRNVDEPESNQNLIETEDPEDIAPLSPNGGNNSVIEPSTSADSPNMLSGVDFRFYIKDHLGNNREVIGMDGKIKQRTDYYPFGTPIQDLGFGLAIQPYAYNGKEFDTTHGLNTHDYGARQYKTALPRWDRIDPLCEKYYHVSPYAYCFNNPVNAIDPDGKVVIFINGLIAFGAPPAGSQYWNGAHSSFVKAAIKFFHDNRVLFTDSDYSWASSAKERRKSGFDYAKQNFAQLIHSIPDTETIKLVSHSMGAAFAMGIEDYIKSEGGNVKYNIMLNAYQCNDLKVSKYSSTIYVDYKNTNDPVLQFCDLDPLIFKCLMNSDIRIREKSNEKFLLKHRSPLLDGNFWKKLKDFIEHKVDVYERKDNNKFRLD